MLGVDGAHSRSTNTKANGKVVPMQEINGNILFDVDVASAHEGKIKEGYVHQFLQIKTRDRYSSGAMYS